MRKELWRCMIMTGQMTKYKESLRHMPEPIMLSQIQKKVDLRGLMNYAKEKGIKVTQLTMRNETGFAKYPEPLHFPKKLLERYR